MGALIVLLWLAGSVAVAGELGAELPLLGPHTTVVLLAGLPGDVESESNYRDQLEAWLDLAQATGPARDIFVLCDFQESLNLPASNQSPRLNLTRADRTSFLGLSRALGGRTNDVLFVAWGHGGRQRETPVLHVHGPRLTPEDFKSLADAMPGAPGRWVLMFRGSGSFAAQLAGAHRQILSSEHETMFDSDPVGMALLLKLARANPEHSFATLSEDFGRAVGSWYKERHLARTEEPTLWPGTEKPRLLASAVEEDSFASAGPVTAAETNASTSPKPESSAREDLPAAWKEIKPADPQQYPDADAVLLRRRLTYTLANSPAVVAERDEYIQILTAEGKRFGDFDISYSPPDEEISFQDCEVLGTDGKLARLDPDAIHEGAEHAAGDYQAGQRKYFSLPGAGPGAILHVRYRTEWREFPLPHVSLAIPVAGELPVREATLEVSVPKEAPFHFAFDSGPGAGRGQILPDPAARQSSYGSTYSWRFENLPAQDREALSPPGETLRLLVSTFADWPEFAQWYGRVSALADEVTPEIAAKAAELARGAKTDREKVLALYNFVTRLRYVAVPLGVNSFRPHAAGNVLQNQFGDCKDKANLFDALLHALHLQASLVLVPRFSQAYEAIPGLAFNHAISRVTLGPDTLWVDTTDDVCRFGMLPPGDPGRKVLVIDGQSGTLAELPRPEPKEHLLKLSAEIDASAAGTELPASLKAVAQGYPDYELRAAARVAKEMGGAMPLLAECFRPVNGAFALEKQSATAIAALDENFTWQAQGTYVGLAPAGTGAKTLRAPFWLPKEWDLALHRRASALFLNQGYPLTLEEEFAFALPAGARAPVLPNACGSEEAPLRWRIEWQKVAADKVAVKMRAELAHGELSASETPAFQRQLRELLAAAAAGAGLAP
jgi:hypothetical protein